MGDIAFVFPGQGSQYPGMAHELYDFSPAARRVFDQAETIRLGTTLQTFEGDEEELKRTVNAQPCLYCAELAIAEVLCEGGIVPTMVAGFSLGEVAALTFAGVFSPEEGFSYVCRRGASMQEAASQVESAMLAVLKLDDEVVEHIASEFDDVYPVNYNCPGQLVVAGPTLQLEFFKERVRDAGGRALSLPVSGGFHSPFMNSAYQDLSEYLMSRKVSSPRIPIYANLTGDPYDYDVECIKKTMASQIVSPVRWQRDIEHMIRDGADIFIEVGPGKTLSGFIRRIAPDVTVLQVEDSATYDVAIEAVKKR